MAAQKKQLRRAITQRIDEPAAPFEKRVAEILQKKGEFRGELSSDQLSLIMRKVLYTLVAEQKVAGFDVPIVHNVTAINVRMGQHEARVFAELHVHSPITAFIQFRYCLENGSQSPGKRLRLKGNYVEVKEVTRTFDFGAKAALRIMGVKHIALRELSDPNTLIRRTLPPHLKPYGFQGALTQVELELTDEDTMLVYLVAKRKS
jgi:hypothetical protein